MIPLIFRLKKENQRRIAKIQDLIVVSLFEVFEKKAVLHGGTAIWRCYKGNRFSEDVDVYIIRDLEKLDEFFDILAKKGLALERKKISENSIYPSLKLENTIVRF